MTTSTTSKIIISTETQLKFEIFLILLVIFLLHKHIYIHEWPWNLRQHYNFIINMPSFMFVCLQIVTCSKVMENFAPWSN